jgi:hypothetical protein
MKFAVTLPVAAVLLLNGCTSVKLQLGIRTALEKIPVSSIEATLPKGPGIAPGEKSPLIVVVTRPDGTKLQTEGAGKGQVMWKDLVVTASVANVDKKGVVSLPRDPRVSEGKVPHIIVTVPSHPELRAELDIPIRYDSSFVANFSGKTGASGTSGLDGLDGSSGNMGSMDPNNPSAGGNGSNGSNGSDGKDGEPGGDAPPVHVQVTLKPGSRSILEVVVSAAGHQKLFLVDPNGGSLTVKADGGRGGAGGSGGRGGRGGSGGIGTPSGSSGSDGMSGRNGFDGPPGKGGSITVTCDPQAKAYLSVIHLSNEGGPPPVFKEESVAPLW